MAMQYSEDGKLVLNPGQIAKISITQRSDDNNEQIIYLGDQDPLDVSITGNGESLRFAYTIDKDDKELCIIIPDVAYLAIINGNSFEGSPGNTKITQKIKGNANSVIAKHTGGTIIGNHTGDITL